MKLKQVTNFFAYSLLQLLISFIWLVFSFTLKKKKMENLGY